MSSSTNNSDYILYRIYDNYNDNEDLIKILEINK